MPKRKIILKRKPGLYLKDTGAKGRGVFCTRPIRAGEALEVSPSILLNESATAHIDKTLLINYAFMTGKIPKRVRAAARIKNPYDSSVMIMGIASFCNHGENPNADIGWEAHDGTLYYTLTATRAIPKNTEICTTYGKGWFEDRPDLGNKK